MILNHFKSILFPKIFFEKIIFFWYFFHLKLIVRCIRKINPRRNIDNKRYLAARGPPVTIWLAIDHRPEVTDAR